MSKKYLFAGDGEFVEPEVFIGKQARDGERLVMGAIHRIGSGHSANSELSKPADILDLSEISRVKADDIPGNHQHDQKVKGARGPLDNRMQFA